MNSHPSHDFLAPTHQTYPPLVTGSAFQVYNDLKFAQRWRDIHVIHIEDCSRPAFQGKKPDSDTTLSVVPCSITESLSLSWLQNAFAALGEPPHVFLAITSDDSSIVYYKISTGIVKPPM